MKDWMVLREPAAIKALAHPLRLEILERLVEEPASVNQLAGMMQEVHAKLFYHVKELEKQGLLELVGEQIKNGIVEKFYRATARTFFLGQAVGRYSETEREAERAITADLLRRRRQDVLRVDNRAVARNLVRDALSLPPGAKVILEGASYQRELLEAIMLECRLQGSEAFIRLMNPDVLLQLARELTPEQLAEAPPLTTHLYGQVDVWISFDAIPESALFAQLEASKIEALIKGELQAYERGPKRFASVVVGYPTPERAAELGVDYTCLHDSFWQAMNVKTSLLQEKAEQWLATLQPGNQVQLGNDQGTHITCRVSEGDSLVVNAGSLDWQEVRPESLTDLQLPGGQLFFLPEPGSLNGQLCIPRYLIGGRVISDLRVTIEQGRVVSWRAEQGGEFLPLLRQATNSDLIGRLSLGFNPLLQKLTGYKYLDAVTEGCLGLSFMAVSDSAGTSSSTTVPLWLYSSPVRLT